VITEIFAPFPLGSVALTVVAFHSSPSIGDALKWEGSTLLLVSLLPLTFLLRQMRHGKVTDYHVRQREQRLPVFAVFLVSWLVALLVLVRLSAPRELVALIVTVFVWSPYTRVPGTVLFVAVVLMLLSAIGIALRQRKTE